MSRIATITPVWGCKVEEMRTLATLAEDGGFEGIFSPEVPPFNAISNSQIFAEVTKKIKVGTWIANIYMRHPVIAAAAALNVQEITGGRMLLGLGVSHGPVNKRFGIDMGDPVTRMREYVKEIKSYADGSSDKISIKRDLPAFPVYIAGLTRKSAELAGEVADGLMPYMCPPKYLSTLKQQVEEGAKRAGRDISEIEITNGIPSFVSDDEETALKAAKAGLSNYARLPFYQRLIKNIGHGDVVEKIQNGTKPAEAMTDELINDIALVGPADKCREKLKTYYEAGTQLAIIVPGPVGKQSNVEVMKNTVSAYS